MKMFGSWSELVAILFRKNAQNITVRPNNSTTYTADRTFDLPPGDSSQVLLSATSTQTVTGKTIDGDDNTVQDLPVTSIKTVLGDANKALVRDASGVPTSAFITNANVDAAAAIDASKIANGSVSSTEFQYLSNVTSDIQTQIDGKQPLDSDLTAIAGLSGTGVIARTGSGTAATRTILGGSGISVTDGDGVAGNPTIAVTGPTLTRTSTDVGANRVQNKDLDDATVNIVDDADTTKKARFEASGITAGQTRIMTIPDSNFTFVGTSLSQVITNKDIDGGTASNTSRITVPKETTTNLNALTRKQATIVYNTTTNTFQGDNGTTLSDFAAAVDASPTQSGQVNTTTQTFAGAKTWNDVQTWKASSGSLTTGSYNTSGAWTLGPTSGSVTHTIQSGATTIVKVYTAAAGSTDTFVDFYPGGSGGAGRIRSVAATDSGISPVTIFTSTQSDGSSALTSRRAFGWENGPTSVGYIDASGNWIIGKTSGAGNYLVANRLFNVIQASDFTRPGATITSANLTTSILVTSNIPIVGSGAFTLSGMAALNQGTIMVIHNNTDNTMTVAHNDTTNESTASARIQTRTGANVAFVANSAAMFVRGSDRWLLISG